MVRLTYPATWLLAFLLAGCTATPAPPGAPEPPRAPPSSTSTATPPVSPGAPGPDQSVTLALYEQADAARQKGDLDGAITTLERAIRIDPDAAELWLLLGEVNLENGDAAAAQQFARKALQFVGNRSDLEQRAYSLLDAARRRPD